MRHTSVLLCLLTAVSFFTACTTDVTPEVTVAERLPGRWELVRGMRNNVETTTLGDLYYNFGVKGGLETNLLGDAQQGSYRLVSEDTEIETQGVKLPLTYEIIDHSDSTLHLRARHQGYLFDFELARAE